VKFYFCPSKYVSCDNHYCSSECRAGFSPHAVVFPCQCSFTNAPCLFSHLSLTQCNCSSRQHCTVTHITTVVEPCARPAYSNVHPHSLFLQDILECYHTPEDAERKWTMAGEDGRRWKSHNSAYCSIPLLHIPHPHTHTHCSKHHSAVVTSDSYL
jgi:hypothetical protein